MNLQQYIIVSSHAYTEFYGCNYINIEYMSYSLNTEIKYNITYLLITTPNYMSKTSSGIW